MNKKDLITILENIKNAKRLYRDQAAEIIIENPDLFPLLIDKVFDTADALHIRAAWTFELICLENIENLDPFINQFIAGISKLKHESALRPVSKICSLWIKRYFLEKKPIIKLTKKEIEQLISCNFDWLIGEHKVATQVFAMDTLAFFAVDELWIKQELTSILEKNAENGSSGYKAHARKLLKNL